MRTNYLLRLFLFLVSPISMWGQWEKIPTPYFSETGQVQAFDNQLFCHTRDGIYRSKNAGQSWELMVKGLCCNGYYHFLNINPATKHYYFVNEEDGQIQISQDGGNTWQNWGQMPVSTPFFERQRGLFFYDNKVYVFQQNYLAIRENGGPLNGWRPLLNLSVTPDSTGFIYNIIQNGTHLWAETNFGVYHSSNLGVTWTKPLGNTLRRLVARGDTMLVYAGDAPALLTNNNGASWQTIQLPFKTDKIHSTATKFYAVVSDSLSAFALFSGFNGEDWQLTSRNLYVNSVAQLDKDLFFAVSEYGILTGNLLKSSDGGATLYFSNGGLPIHRAIVPTARFVENYLHLSDGFGVSEDGGDTWPRRWQGYALAPQDIIRAGNTYRGQYNISGSYFSPQICPANGRFEWTTPVLTNSPASLPRMTALGDRVYGAALNQTELYRSSPDGQNWTKVGAVPTSNILIGWRGKLFSSDGSKLVYSADEGQSWQSGFDVGGAALSTQSRFFVSGDTLVFSHVTNRKIYYSTDDGLTVDTIPAPYETGANFFRLRAFGNTFVLYIGNGENVYVSNNRGQQWLKVPMPVGAGINTSIDLLTANEHTLIVPTGQGHLWRLRFDGLRNLRGQVYFDANANGAQDAGETGVPDRLLQASRSSFIALTGADGRFTLPLSSATDTVRMTNVPLNFRSNPANLVVSGTDTAAVKLGLQPQGSIRDAMVRLIVPRPFRAGFDNQINIIVSNQGTRSINPRLKLALDPNISFESASPPPDLVTSDSLVWNLSGLPPIQSSPIAVQLKAAVVPPNTPVQLRAQAALAQENTPVDNTALYTGAVVAAYDPNDKAVSPSILSPSDAGRKELVYTIRFQNLGNAATDFVTLRDTLPAEVDPARVRVLGSSHPMRWRLLAGRVLEFQFNPLALPPAEQDEPGSQGFVQFGVMSRPGLAVGALVQNKASIYFDFNPAVVTNVAGTEVKVVSVSAPASEVLALEIFPNPARQQTQLRCAAPASAAGHLLVFDAQGKRCFQTSTQGNAYTLALSTFTPGVYGVYWTVGEAVFGGRVVVSGRW